MMNKCDKVLMVLVSLLICLMLGIGFLGFCTDAQAGEVTIDWDHNNPLPEGYRVFMRYDDNPYDYSTPIWEGSASRTEKITIDDNRLASFVVRAFVGDLSSEDSEEVSTIIWTKIQTPLNVRIF
jgi:hypothetical protein